MPELTGQFFTVEKTVLPRQYQVAQGGIYAGLLKEKFAKEGPLNPDNFKGILMFYICRDDYRTKTFFIETSDTYLTSARSFIRTTNALVSEAEQEDTIDAKRSVIKRLPPKCRTRNDKTALECPWRLICFPYKDTSKNKLEVNIDG
jgi:hypothetical protein